MKKRLGYLAVLIVIALVSYFAGTKASGDSNGSGGTSSVTQTASQPDAAGSGSTDTSTAGGSGAVVGADTGGSGAVVGADAGGSVAGGSGGAQSGQGAAGQGSTDQGSASQGSADQALAYPPVPEGLRAARVRHISDGDSFDIIFSDNSEQAEVRLLAINAPEKGDCFAENAGNLLASFVDNKEVLIDYEEHDRYGRILADVYTSDGLLLNVRLVAEGAAFARASSSQHFGLILQAQESAESQQLGMFNPAMCGSPWKNKMGIDSVFADAPGRDDENMNGEYVVLANTSDEVIDISNWYVRDESTRNRHYFENTIVEAGAFLIIRSGCGQNTQEEQFWCAEFPVWNNNGDSAYLIDSEGLIVDTLHYQR